MADEWKTYVTDPRRICKYGPNCYQKSPEHHRNFKHAPKMILKGGRNGNNRARPYNIKPKNVSCNDVSSTTPDDEMAKKLQADQPSLANDNPSTSQGSSSPPHHSSSAHPTSINRKISYYNTSDLVQLKELFLVEMPEDFYKFHEFLGEFGQDIEKVMSGVNLQLIGPYEMLLNKLPIVDNKELYYTHWRFFYDPPEFQAVMKSCGKSEYHIGYYRDSPDEKPVFLGSNDCSKDCIITPLAENVFGAAYMYLEKQKKQSPFTSMACQKMMEKLKNFADKHNISLEPYNIRERNCQVVAKTFHGAGVVVPYDKKTKLGYRPLAETNGAIKKLFSQLQSATSQSEKDKLLSDLQPVITYANIAVDECDFGTGLECGIDLFCSGIKELESSAVSSLCAAYHLLKRDAFAKIIQAHMKYRRKGPNMSLLSIA